MKPLTLLAFALASVSIPVLSAAQEPPMNRRELLLPRELVFGRMAKIDLNQGGLEGELLSVSADSLWVLGEAGMLGLPLGEVRGVDVRMHDWGTRRVLLWNVVAGLGSALALTAACNSVESNSGCGSFLLGWSLSWGLVGGLAGAAIASSSHREVPMIPDAIRPYVRYPQGLPPGVRPAGGG